MDTGVASTAHHGNTTARVLDELFTSFRLLLDYDRVGYAVIRPPDSVVAAWVRSISPGPLRLHRGFRARLSDTTLPQVAASGQPRAIDDLREYAIRRPTSVSTKLLLAEGIRSNLTCPIQVHDRTAGFLFFSSFRPNAYRDVDQAALIGLSRMLSAVVTLEADRVAAEAIGHAATLAAHRDPMTDLLNRRGFADAVRRLEQQQSPNRVALIYVDIDALKTINDELGHAAGDAAITEVAHRLRHAVRDSDLVARLGGDEFLVLAQLGYQDDADALAERICESVRGGPPNSTLPTLSVSTGVQTIEPTNGLAQQLPHLIDRADAEMYRTKRAHRR